MGLADMTLCKGCGKEIVWGETIEGKKIPLDPRAPVYALMAGQSLCGLKAIFKISLDEAMVSHFATCPKASQF